jgi:Ca2+-binding RTX toxin-like protein
MADTAPGEVFAVEMRGESRGVFGFAGDAQNNALEQTGDFTGINWVSLQPTTDVALHYDARNADTDMRVSGAAGNDLFLSGDGNETFTLGGGADNVVFDFTQFEQSESPTLPAMGFDRITDFDPNADTLSFSGGEGQFTTNQVEHDGVTTFDSYDLQGRHIHHLDVMAVGLPPMEHDIIFG